MPDAEEPIFQANIILNTQGLKVYSAGTIGQIEADQWEVNQTLICTGRDNTAGATLGALQFAILPGDNDTTREDYSDELSVVRISAAQDLGADTSSRGSGIMYIRVTDTVSGIEIPIFYGYINSVTYNIVRGRSTAIALSYAGLLARVGLLGWFWDIDDSNTTEWFPQVLPVFNPDGMGNKSAGIITSGGLSCPAINQTNILLGETADNKFTVLDVLNSVFIHMTHADTVLTDSIQSVNPWKFAKRIYRAEGDSPAIVEISGSLDPEPGEDGGALLDLSQSFAVDNYTYVGKTIWEAIVELVESVDNLVVTEKLDYSSGLPKPSIFITKTQVN